MFLFLTFILGQICFSPFLICRSPIVRGFCSSFGSSEVIFQSCGCSTTADSSFHSKFPRKKGFKGRKNQKQPLELFWEKEMFLKVAVPVKFAVKIHKKYLWRCAFLVKLQNVSLQLYWKQTSSQVFFEVFVCKC